MAEPTGGDQLSPIGISDTLLAYFNEEIHDNETSSIVLLGCGEAGGKLAGVFRLKPDYVPAYHPKLFPVRAIAVDTQATITDNLAAHVGWRDSGVQFNLTAHPADDVPRVLGYADFPFQRGVIRTGGSGGYTLIGRAAAIHNLLEDSNASEAYRRNLEAERILARTNNGYLLTFSGLFGGTGSGSAPVAAQWVREKLDSQPTATFSVCIVPREAPRTEDDARRSNPRLLNNLLSSLYFLAKSDAIDGIILADNLRLEQQGHGAGAEFVSGINRYLQDVLMPVFLSTQSEYLYISQLDPSNVQQTMQRGVIVAGFSVFPLPSAPQRIKDMTPHLVEADPATNLPRLIDMLEVALECTTIDCEPGTARRALALLAGPRHQIEQLDQQNNQEFQRAFEDACLSGVGAGSQSDARFFMAVFPEMTDVRLTVLLSGSRMPDIELAIRTALEDDSWGPRGDETLAEALRLIPEDSVVGPGLELILGPQAS